MSAFAPSTTAPAKPPDPTKHVFYNLGMVLGVDDFNQEFAYLSARDRTIARDLIGYGTAVGLRVVAERIASDPRGPRVVVEPGLAVTPRGQLVRVSPSQCAYLNPWIAGERSRVRTAMDSSPGMPLGLYVVLCYRECADDPVPIPGEPCRTEDEYTAPSRLVDDFRLELRFEPPQQREEHAIRQFVAWLRNIRPVEGGEFVTLADFLDRLRDAAQDLGSPLDPGLGFESPPEPIRVPASEMCEYLRAAFRVWVTELRPMVHPDVLGRTCGCGDGVAAVGVPEEECLLLAELRVPLLAFGDGFVVNDSQPIEVIETDRPVLVHLRMLQENLLCGPRGGHSAEPGDTVTEERAFGLAANPGAADEYSRADHTHGTPTLPDLGSDATGPIANATVVALRGVQIEYPPGTPVEGNILRLRSNRWRAEAMPSNPPLAGDATGPVNATRVVGLRNVGIRQYGPLPTSRPNTNDILFYNGTEWQAGPVPAQPPAIDFRIVAAGRFGRDGNPASVFAGFTFHDTVAVPVPFNEPMFAILFRDSDMQRPYVIKAEVITALEDLPVTTDVLFLEDRIVETLRDALNRVAEQLGIVLDELIKRAFLLRVRAARKRSATDQVVPTFLGFMVEVSDFDLGR